MNKYKTIILLGVLNVIHGGIHIFQFLQSMALAYYYNIEGREHNWLHGILEHPVTGFVMGFVGFLTLGIGYRDYKHHKNNKCVDN